MTFFIENWTYVLMALMSGGLLLWPVIAGGGMSGGLAPTDAVQLMNREKAVVVDVCSASEFAAGHIKGAKHIPLDELEAKLAGVVKNKTAPLILVCASGMRSGRAVGVAKKLGFENTHSLAGGMSAWRGANLPVEKA